MGAVFRLRVRFENVVVELNGLGLILFVVEAR